MLKTVLTLEAKLSAVSIEKADMSDVRRFAFAEDHESGRSPAN